MTGDFLTTAFEPASFDVVTAVASLHHMDAAAALTRMRDLVRPGGVLVAWKRDSGDGAFTAELAAAQPFLDALGAAAAAPDILRRRICEPWQVERVLRLPVLGMLEKR